MKREFKITFLTMLTALLLTTPIHAFEGRNAYEAGDGHWIYFGPDSSSSGSTHHVMPRKRSLEQSIRRDALRNYEMPRYELAESGEVISFYGEDTMARTETATRPALRRADQSQGNVFEMPESGHVIRFTQESATPAPEKTVAARQLNGPS